ncbi:MAG: hypothetical protein SVR04_17345, partial [Spirochaetota bacterium]|nr:hypothetical protein [Spirochaetota bacterium]
GELVSAAQVCPAVECAAMPFSPAEPSTISFGVGNSIQRYAEASEFFNFQQYAYSSQPGTTYNEGEIQQLEEIFLNSMQALGRREEGEALLDLARLSYRLRDDDNIYVASIRGEYLLAEEIYRRKFISETVENGTKEIQTSGLHRRQVTGTRASDGIAAGPARLVLQAEDLFKVKKGEVIVCDSIDPNMTFVIPLAAAVVGTAGRHAGTRSNHRQRIRNPVYHRNP